MVLVGRHGRPPPWCLAYQGPGCHRGRCRPGDYYTAGNPSHQERHWPDSPAQGAGKFSPGITENSLKQLVGEAVANGRMRRNTHGRPGQLYEYDFGHPIGITMEGRPAFRLRVVVNRWNQLITAFPF